MKARIGIVLCLAAAAQADVHYFAENFEDIDGLVIEGNASYWGIAPVIGTEAYPSPFSAGGRQSGKIWYGVNGYDSTARMTIALPEMAGCDILELSVALAAPGHMTWESTHRDSLHLWCETGPIDSFLPTLRGSPLRSGLHGIDLSPVFQEFRYTLPHGIRSLTFAFASTALNEVIGIDSLCVTGCVVPVPGAAMLGVIGLAWAGRKLGKCVGRI